MAVRSSELHRAGDTVYRCGLCRRGRHGKCTTARPCQCAETPECSGSVDLEHAEQTLRRIQAEQAERAAAEPATPPAPVHKFEKFERPRARAGSVREKVLRYLAQQGSVEDADGAATRRLHDAIGVTCSNQALLNVLGELDKKGLIERVHPRPRRTSRISITAAGREAVGSSPGVSDADGTTPTPLASVQPVGRDNPTGAVSEAPGDEPSVVSEGQGPPTLERAGDPPSPASPSEAAADPELALLAERLRARLRRSLVLAVEPFIEGPRDAEWHRRLFDLFDLGDPT